MIVIAPTINIGKGCPVGDFPIETIVSDEIHQMKLPIKNAIRATKV